jgi:PAS domain S-box-containing protein
MRQKPLFPSMERRDSERVLFDQLGEPAVETQFEDEMPVVQAVNDAFETTFGVSETEIVGDSLDAHIVPSGDEGRAEEMNRTGAQGEPVEREVRRQTADGPRWFLLRSVPFESDGQQHGYGIYIDITDRKQQEKRFQELIRHSTDILTILDASGTYQYQSPSARRLLGYDPEGMVGDNAFDYVHPDDRQQVMVEFADAVGEPDASPQVEYRFQHSDGSWRWLESIGNNQLANPAVEGFVVNSRDISERVEFERELQLLTEVFTRVFRHNVRNKLNIIEGHATLAADHCERNALSSIETITDTTAKLLEHSRKAQLLGRIVDTRERHVVDLDEYVTDIVTAAQNAYPDATITADIDPKQVQAHPELNEGIRELIVNAVRHAPTDHDPRVELLTETEPVWVTLVVEDDAGGLRESEIAVLEQEQESKLKHGSGVGLWLVRWIAERSGGEMSIEQTAEGSRVALRLPTPDADDGGNPAPTLDPAS